jgi:secretion/DNA translocation related TadE-like protein
VKRGTDDGSGTIWVLALTMLVCAAATAVLVLVQVRVVRAHAITAADLAALAAAAELPLTEQACTQAARVAQAQGAVLSSCTSDGEKVDVEVTCTLSGPLGAVGIVRARSRAGTQAAR